MSALPTDQTLPCPVCGGTSSFLDVVDFNKSCEDAKGPPLELSGIPIEYTLCDRCGFCFAPELMAWPLETFEERIYNDEYILVDPDYVERRPRANAAWLVSMFADRARSIRHLDYGGGSGVLSQALQDAGWQSASYDPFVNRDVTVERLGPFDLITAFEVFEHVPDVPGLMARLRSLLAPDGLLLFSTVVSDGHIQPDQRLSWWYASPRNGHISLFSRSSLEQIARDHGFDMASFSEGFHVFFTRVPAWAREVIPAG